MLSKVVRRHDHGAVRVLQRGCETAADDVAKDVEDHNIGVFQQVMLFQQFHGLANNIAATARCQRVGRQPQRTGRRCSH